MLRKIYQELIAIRRELQAINKNPGSTDGPVLVREPYGRRYVAANMEWRRFELLVENEAERFRLEKTLKEHNLSRQDLAVILFGLRVRPEFGKKDFGI